MGRILTGQPGRKAAQAALNVWAILACLAACASPGERRAPGMKPGDVWLTIYSPDSKVAKDLGSCLDHRDWVERAGFFSGERREDQRASPDSQRALETLARFGGLGVVTECRTFSLPKGVSECRFADVADLIDPTTVRFVDQTDPQGTRVVEQDFRHDLASQEAILKRSLGRTVEFIDPQRRRHRGALLAHKPSLILRTRRGGIQMITWPRRKNYGDLPQPGRGYTLHLPELPRHLLARPTLAWKLRTRRAGDHDIAVSYQALGLTWCSDYTALLNAEETHTDLSGWVTIANASGARFPRARIKLFAGDVRRFVQRPPPEAMAQDFFGDEDVEEEKPAFEEKPFFEYHLYTLRGRTTLENSQIKQIEFLNVRQVPVEKAYTYDGLVRDWDSEGFVHDVGYGTKCRTTVRTNVELQNREASGLGIPLPGGVVRFAKVDPNDGQQEFIGRESIDHTPRDETVRLYVGDAFDLVGCRVRTHFQAPVHPQVRETFEIELRNHKHQPVTVRVLEHLYRAANWKIEKSSLPFEKLDAQSIAFSLRVPGDGKAKVTYTVAYWWHEWEQGAPEDEF